jgi:flagellar assembly protein FliH
MTTPHKKFGFDTVFDAGGGIAYAPPQQKRVFTAAEVDQIRTRSRAEGEASAVARAEEAQAAALAEIAKATHAALSVLAQTAHNHRAAATELALAAAKAIAGAALEQSSEAPAAAALHALAREVEAAPRLNVRASPELVDRTQAALDETALACGFPGQISVKADPALPGAAFVFDWGEGKASFDPVDAEARVFAAVRAALVAEGLHAEPLLPFHSFPSET